MIDAIDGMCRTWGAQKLYMLRVSEVEVAKAVPVGVMAGIAAMQKLEDRQEALDRFKVDQAKRQRTTRFGHEQGWTPQSVLAKFREMRDGAGAGTQRGVLQFVEEGHTGEGLMVARALADAPERLRSVAFVHYVIPRVRSKIKAETLELSVPEYWRFLDRSHYWIAARMSVDGSCLAFHEEQFVETKIPLSQQ